MYKRINSAGPKPWTKFASVAILALIATTYLVKFSGEIAGALVDWGLAPLIAGIVAAGSISVCLASGRKFSTSVSPWLDIGVPVAWVVANVVGAIWHSPWAYLVLIAASFCVGWSKFFHDGVEFLNRRFRHTIVKILDLDSEDEFGSEMLRKNSENFQKSDNALLRGDVLAAALEKYPFEKYPSLYQQIDPDMVRPIHHNDRLPDGDFLNFLAPLRVDGATLVQAYNTMFRAPIAFGRALIMTLILSFSVAIVAMPKLYMLGQTTGSEQVLPIDAASIRDYWSAEDGSAAIKDRPHIAEFALTGARGLLAVAAAALLGWSLLQLAFAHAYRKSLLQLLNPTAIAGAIDAIVNSDKALLTMTPRAKVAYEHSLSGRVIGDDGQNSSLVLRAVEKTPFIPFAIGTDVLYARGAQSSYTDGQIVGLNLTAFQRNMFVFGATGSGKTFSVLSPIMRQVLNHATPDEVHGKPRGYNFSMIVTDGGGTLQANAIRMGRDCGYDVRTIGLGPSDVGMDLHEGMDPSTLVCLYEQSGALINVLPATTDASWHTGGFRQLLACITVLRAAECTQWGLDQARERGERVNSPVGLSYLFSATYQTTGVVFDACNAILDAAESDDPEVVAAIAPFLTPSLWSAIEFLRYGCFQIPKKQFDSQREHCMPLMDAFTTNPIMRARFGALTSEDQSRGLAQVLDVDRMFDDKSLSAIMFNTAIDGDVAKVGNVFILTRLIARRSQMAILDHSIRDTSITLVVSDEHQQLITAASTSYSLMKFLPMARKTGMCFLSASQLVSTITQALGGSISDTHSYLNQYVSTIVLPNSDPETLEYLEKVPPTSLRFSPTIPGVFESYWAIRAMQGLDAASDITPYRYRDAEMAKLLERPSTIIGAEMRDIVSTDWHFNDADVADEKSIDWIEKLRGVIWRQEDRMESALAGEREVSLFHPNDFKEAGLGLAFARLIIGQQPKFAYIRLCPELGAAPGEIQISSFPENKIPDFIKNAISLESRPRVRLINSMRVEVERTPIIEERDLLESKKTSA